MRGRGHSKFVRLTQRVLCGQSSAAERRKLHEHLARCADCRAHYDRACLGLRELEGREDWFAGELELVQSRLFDVTLAYSDERSSMLQPRWVVAGALAVVVAVALGLGLGWPQLGASPSMRWAQRGQVDGPSLGLRLMCGVPLRAAENGCERTESMHIAYRSWPAQATDAPILRQQLIVFGIDARDQVMFYLPTPIAPASFEVVAEGWQPLDFAIELGVNHAPGELRFFGLRLPAAVHVQTGDVERWAELLKDQPPARSGDPSWIERLSAGSIPQPCRKSGQCAAVELSIFLHESAR